MGSFVGSQKIAAARVGVPVEEYLARVARGEKWCGGCKVWHPVSAFKVDRSRGDGLSSVCSESRSASARSKYKKRPRGRGRRYVAARVAEGVPGGK